MLSKYFLMLSSIAKFLTKQFLIGKLWLWIKPKIHGLLILTLIIFLIIYVHGEYIAFIEISQSVNSQEYFFKTFKEYIFQNITSFLLIKTFRTDLFYKDGVPCLDGN